MADDSEQYGSRDQLRRRGRNGAALRSTDGMYVAGQPIGFLAARGTPYEKKYLTKKLGFCCKFLAPPITIIALVIALVPIVWAIADHTLRVAQLEVMQGNLTTITNSSAYLSLDAQVKKAGIFPATLYFRAPIEVYWMTPPPNMREVKLGEMRLSRVNAAAGHGKILQSTELKINDEAAFGEFAQYLISEPEFTWNLICKDVHAEAFGFLPTFKNYEFKKHVTFNGFDNFHDVKILDFQLPGNDPAGGITAQVLTSLTNPSPFGVQLGSLELGLYYKDLYLGPAHSDGAVNVTTGANTVLLRSQLIPHADNSTALDMLGEVFTGYINGDAVPVTARGVSTKLANGETVEWLQKGIQALEVNVPLKTPVPIEPIKGINIDYLSLVFDPEKPWAPKTFSNALKGTFALPFGFSLDIMEVAPAIDLVYKNVTVASINGAFAKSATHLDLVSAGQTAGMLDLTLLPTELTLPEGPEQQVHDNFVAFQKALLFAPDAEVELRGAAKTLTDTPVGRVLLNGIKFNVGSGLRGLDSLTRYPTEITSIDVMGGTPGAVDLVVGTAVINPSNLNLTTGDATFDLINQVPLGKVTLPNLNLKIGRNDINATSAFSPNAHPKGIETLGRFLSGLDTNLNISGFDGSSEIVSLNPVFELVKLNATLPGLKKTLVQSAKLEVLDTTGVKDNIANGVVAIANPFTSNLTITRIKSKVYSHGIFLADIDTPINLPAQGKAVTMSPNVPLGINLYPPDLFSALRAYAVQANLDPAYIDGIVALGGFTLTPTTNADSTNASATNFAKRDELSANEGGHFADMLMGVRSNVGDLEETGLEQQQPLQKRANLYSNFNLPNYVNEAFKVAKADLVITSDAVIGEYGTTLTFAQQNVPLQTDETLFKLLPVLAKPIVQKVVDGAILNIDRATVLNPQQESFGTLLQGSLTQAGPFDAIVEFTEGLSVNYKGRLLGQISMPNITLVGDVGSTLDLTADFKVADVPFMTEFAKTLLAEPTFVWNIAGKGIKAHALGIQVPNITISKDVILTGFNGLKGDVIINSFDIPSNDPAGGVTLTAAATINSRSQVGVQLSRFGSNIMGNGTDLGPAAADPFTLQALAQTPISLKGRLYRQDSQDGLDVLSNIFTNFVHDQNTMVKVAPQFAGPESVTWLNDAIKTITLDVSLPSQNFQVLKAVSLNQLTLAFTTNTAWSPETSTANTTAPFFLPFAFPVDITSATGKFIANYNGQDAAVLNVPDVPAKTDVGTRVLTLAFENIPFQVYDDAHSTFSQFLADATAKDQVTFNLHGSTTAKTNIALGPVVIRDVPFSVDSTILGVQNFNARPAKVSNLDVVHGYPDYLKVSIDTALYNPSDLTFTIGDVNFNTLYTNHVIGKALINGLTVTPGVNNLPTELDYSPQGGANVRAGQTLLENYVQNITSTANVQGSYGSTPIESLQQALAGVSLNADIPPLGKLIITQAILELPKNIAQNGGYASAAVVVDNPFTAGLNIIKVKADADYSGITIGQINQDLSNNPIRAPGKQATQSQFIPIKIDIRPKTLVRFVLALFQNTGGDLGPWPKFFQEILSLPGDAPTQVVPYPDDQDTGCHIGNQFDLLGAVLAALKKLAVRVPIESSVLIDDYFTNLNFVQDPVPARTDNTALYLLGPAGAPLIQLIVDQAGLVINRANATHITDNGFTTTLAGSLNTDAPANALIEFLKPVQINWEGTDIAEISLPPLCTVPGAGVPNLDITAQLRITNLDAFIRFATYILHNQRFTWRLRSQDVRVRALGIAFSNVHLDKEVSLDVFNNLPGVTVNSFDIPSEGPDYLNFVADSSIPSPSALGVELGTATFHISFRGTYLGPASAYNLFLLPKATTQTKLYGQLIRQNNAQDLENLGLLFSQFLAGKDSTLQVQGWEVISPAQASPVYWLSTAFKTLTLDVILPGKIFQIIFSITISDLTVVLLGDPSAVSYHLPTSNDRTVAKYSNPFHFTLSPVTASPNLFINYNGVDAAQLKLDNVPAGGESSSGPERQSDLILSFRNKTVDAVDRGAFEAFLAALTDTPGVSFGLHGSTGVTADTHIGRVTITGIPLNVTSSLRGINSFNHEAPVSDVVVQGSTPQYIKIPLSVTLFNPSNITLYTRDLFIPAQYEGAEIGRAFIDELSLLPGENKVKSEFRYWPDRSKLDTAEKVLQLYLEPANSGRGGSAVPQSAPLTIGGRPAVDSFAETPYDSLLPALYGVSAKSTLPGIGARLVDLATVKIDIVAAFATNMANSSLTLNNLLPPGLTINHLNSKVYKSGVDDDVRAEIDYEIPGGFNVPGMSKRESPDIPTLLTKGALASLDLLLEKTVDTKNVIRVTLEGGFVIESLVYNLYDVPTKFFVNGVPFSLGAPGELVQGLINVAGASNQVSQVTETLGSIPGNVLRTVGQVLSPTDETKKICNEVPAFRNLPACQSMITSSSTAPSSTPANNQAASSGSSQTSGSASNTPAAGDNAATPAGGSSPTSATP